MEFERKVNVQAVDSFPVKADLSEVDLFIRQQRVPGELIISYPGNAGRSSVIFKGKQQVHKGEIQSD